LATSPQRHESDISAKTVRLVHEQDVDQELQHGLYSAEEESDAAELETMMVKDDLPSRPTSSSTHLESIPEEDSNELIEQLLRQAETNLSSQPAETQLAGQRIKLSPGIIEKPYFEITKKGNKLLTDNLDDSLIVTAGGATIKRLDPPISKSQNKKVIPLCSSLQ
jgi:hypothetical protein